MTTRNEFHTENLTDSEIAIVSSHGNVHSTYATLDAAEAVMVRLNERERERLAANASW